jgi:hypothetical protein
MEVTDEQKIEKLKKLGWKDEEIAELDLSEVPNGILLIADNQKITASDIAEAEKLFGLKLRENRK